MDNVYDRVILADGTVVRISKVHHNSSNEIIGVEVGEAYYDDSEIAYYLSEGEEVTDAVMREALGDDAEQYPYSGYDDGYPRD